jgi:hypothetical protein
MILHDIHPGPGYCADGANLRKLLDAGIPKLEQRPEYLWRLGYYDGPLSGICKHHGETHHFVCVDEIWIPDPTAEEEEIEDDEDYFDRTSVRIYVIHPLTAHDIREETRCHQRFLDHYSRKDHGTRWKEYRRECEENPKQVNYSEYPISAWYTNATPDEYKVLRIGMSLPGAGMVGSDAR